MCSEMRNKKSDTIPKLQKIIGTDKVGELLQAAWDKQHELTAQERGE